MNDKNNIIGNWNNIIHHDFGGCRIQQFIPIVASNTEQHVSPGKLSSTDSCNKFVPFNKQGGVGTNC